MKATVINHFGEAKDVFQVIDLPKPEIQDDELLIKVMATSVNPIDYKIRGGYLPHLIPSFPAILHGDVSGLVERVGAQVKGFQPGDKVYACIGGAMGIDGASAEFAKGDYRLFSKIPTNLSYAQAAAVPLVGITAYEAMFEKANIQPGQKVLVFGGVGGVGHFGVQFAKALGAEVFATVSNDLQAKTVKKLGADYAINYKTEKIENFVQKYTDGQGFDVVFDTVGNEHLVESFKFAKMNGTVITVLALATVDLSLFHENALSLHAVYMITPILYNDKSGKEAHGQILRHISTLIEEGKVTPLIDDRIFSFENIAEAHEYSELGKKQGKVVIVF